MTDFHIPTPEESNQKREEKRGRFSWLKRDKPVLEVPPSVGEEKTVHPPPRPPTQAAPTTAEPSPAVPRQAASRPRAVKIDPSVVAARGGSPSESRSAESPVTESTGAGAAPAPPPDTPDHEPSDIPTVPEPPVDAPAPDLSDVMEHETPPLGGPDVGPGLQELMDTVEALRREVQDLRTQLAELARERGPEPAAPTPEPAGVTVEPDLPSPAVSSSTLLNEAVDTDSLLSLPQPYPPADLAGSVRQRGELFHMTNRLNPLKLSVRVLANMRTTSGAWPTLEEFQWKAAWAARHVGQRLKSDDTERRAPRSERRAVAYPTGPRVEQSLQRFIMSFTLDPYADHGGPLQLLNLARIEEERAVLTPSGWALASQSGPLLDDDRGHLLNEAEMGILRHQLQEAPGEGASVARFLRLVQEARGVQTMLDEYLDDTLPEWVTDVVSWRGGMLGRLRDVGLVEVDGEGRNARISLTDASRNFLRAWPE